MYARFRDIRVHSVILGKLVYRVVFDIILVFFVAHTFSGQKWTVPILFMV